MVKLINHGSWTAAVFTVGNMKSVNEISTTVSLVVLSV